MMGYCLVCDSKSCLDSSVFVCARVCVRAHARMYTKTTLLPFELEENNL